MTVDAGGNIPIYTAHDTIDRVNPEELAFMAEVVAAVVDHLFRKVQ